jgi:hypothetical protein
MNCDDGDRVAKLIQNALGIERDNCSEKDDWRPSMATAIRESEQLGSSPRLRGVGCRCGQP